MTDLWDIVKPPNQAAGWWRPQLACDGAAGTMAEYVALAIPGLQRILTDCGLDAATWTRGLDLAHNETAGAAARLLLLALHVEDRLRRGDADGAAVVAFRLGEAMQLAPAMIAMMKLSAVQKRDAWRGKLGGDASRVPALEALWAALGEAVPSRRPKAMLDWLSNQPMPYVVNGHAITLTPDCRLVHDGVPRGTSWESFLRARKRAEKKKRTP